MLLEKERIDIEALLTQYFELAKTKELEIIERYLSPRFQKFGDSVPYEKRSRERALMLEQLYFASVSDFDFKISDLEIDVAGERALATFVLDTSGMVVDDYSFRGAAVKSRLRVTVVLEKNQDGWKMLHQHMSRFG
ncbi:MAG: nuclear transport factor 2 family protein [Nitrososphaera sp.]|jgi:ketosteroid isomerase-like protein